MCSDKKLEANRRNAEKSTGPRTVRGKRRSSRNAITIGLFTRHVVLGRESRRTFDAILDALIDEHRPQTVTELHLVERIAESMWRLRRLQKSEKLAHEACRDEIEHKRRESELYAKEFNVKGWKHFQSKGDIYIRPPRVTALEHQVLTQPDLPAATLAVELATSTRQSAAALSNLYERRLEGTIHRALRELRLLRKERTQSKDVPPSPFKRRASSDSLFPVLRGEGRGEGQGASGVEEPNECVAVIGSASAQNASEEPPPPDSTRPEPLSPEYREEGANARPPSDERPPSDARPPSRENEKTNPPQNPPQPQPSPRLTPRSGRHAGCLPWSTPDRFDPPLPPLPPQKERDAT